VVTSIFFFVFFNKAALTLQSIHSSTDFLTQNTPNGVVPGKEVPFRDPMTGQFFATKTTLIHFGTLLYSG